MPVLLSARTGAFYCDLAICSFFVLNRNMGNDGVQYTSAPAQGVFEFCQNLPIRPARPERLFFALLPDPETAIRLDRFRWRLLRENRLNGAPVKTERFHVSLHHVGDYKRLREKFVFAARRAGNAVSMQPFEITLHSMQTFESTRSINGRGKRPLVLLGEGEALLELHRMLGAAMERNGLRAAEHFNPHLTLFYGYRPIPIQAIKPIRFRVKEFKLIHSELGLTRYNEKGSWTLKV